MCRGLNTRQMAPSRQTIRVGGPKKNASRSSSTRVSFHASGISFPHFPSLKSTSSLPQLKTVPQCAAPRIRRTSTIAGHNDLWAPGIESRQTSLATLDSRRAAVPVWEEQVDMFERRKSPWTTPQWLRPCNPPMNHQRRASSAAMLEPVAATQQQQQLVNLLHKRQSTHQDTAYALPAGATLHAELETPDLEATDEMLDEGMPPVQISDTPTPPCVASIMQISPGPRRASLPAINMVDGKTWRIEASAVAMRACSNSLVSA